MILIICLLLLFPQQTFPQKDSTNHLDIYSPSNVKKFADYLFCTRDYLRAAIEYEKYFKLNHEDTIAFKIGLSYSRIGDYNAADSWFKNIFKSSRLSDPAIQEYFKSLFKLENYTSYRKIFLKDSLFNSGVKNAFKLFYFSYLFSSNNIPRQTEFLKPFNDKEKELIKKFYKRKLNPSYKSVSAGVILSAIIPGSGKIYAGQAGDGIFAAIATGLCSFLAYDNFNAGHNLRGWIFSGLSLFFYAGNIYGTAAAVQIYNAGVKFNFENDLKFYLNKENYFTPEYDLCK